MTENPSTARVALVVKSRRASETLASMLPVWRERRNGLSAQQLADRIAQLGGKLGRVAISEIENGRRGVSLDEALLLAAALNVPPPVLFFPLTSGEHVAVTPSSVIHPDLAIRWLVGEDPLASTERTAIGLHEWSEAAWSEAARPLRLYFDHRRRFADAQRADLRVQQAEYVDAPQAVLIKARSRLRERLWKLIEVRDEMRKHDVATPKLEPRWSADLKRLGEEG